jgi:hypothetical protein
MTHEQGAGSGTKWGDAISEDRRIELELILQRWGAAAEQGSRRGPFDGVTLTGADVFYLAACALAGFQGDVAAAAARLLATDRRDEIPPLSRLHLEGAHLAGAYLDGAILVGAHLKGADLSGAHLDGAVLDEAQLAEANFTGAALDRIVLRGDDDDDSLAARGSTRGAGERTGAATDSGEAGETPTRGEAPTGDDSRTQLQQQQVIFTGYYPRDVATQMWERMLVFLALDTAEAAAEVASVAAELLQSRRDEYRHASAPSQASVRRGARLTIVPSLPGFRVDPAAVTADWGGETQCYEFRLRAEQAQPDRAVNGVVQIFEGPLLRGEVPVAIFVQAQRHMAASAAALAVNVRSAAYRNTFPSYSRKDEPLVRAFELVVEATGDRYLRDVRTLRAGEEWAPRLLELIDQADVFQLFWSQAAAESHQVEREWRYALTLAPTRPNFIRPVYWTPKPYKLANELRSLNFGHIDPEFLGFRSATLISRLFGRHS